MPFMNLLGSPAAGAPAPDPNAPPNVDVGLPPAPPVAPSTSTPMGPAAAPGPAPHPAQVEHESRVGRAVRTMLGTQVDYTVDPNTGKTVATPVKASGSQIMRGILAGALLGAEAGQAAHNANPQSGFMGGFASGAGGAMRQATINDERRMKQAQEDFKQQLEARKQSNEDMFREAQIAHMHVEDMHAMMQMDLIPTEHLDKLNEANQALADKYGVNGNPSLIMSGGKNINGQKGNVYDMQKAIQSDTKGVMQAAPGYHRFSTQTVDTTGLRYKPGAGWVDKDGNNVDMATRTTITMYDVPNDTAKEMMQVSGKDLNKMAGIKLWPDDDTTINVQKGWLFSLKDHATKDALEQAQAARQNALAASQAHLLNKQARQLQLDMDKMEDKDIQTERGLLTEKLKVLQETMKRGSDPLATEEQKKDAEDARSDYRQAISTMNAVEAQYLKKHKLVPETPTAAGGGGGSTLNNVFETAFNSPAMLALPLDQQINQINGSSSLSQAQKNDYIQKARARAAAPRQTAAPQPGPSAGATGAYNPSRPADYR